MAALAFCVLHLYSVFRVRDKPR